MAEKQNDIATVNEDTMQGKYLVFILDRQEFAIPILHVIDIINVQPITHVPNCPGYIRGITNLRGKVIPIVDVRARFGKEPQSYNDRTCIIVVEEGESAVGLIIDSVSEVISISDENMSAPPSFNASNESKFIMGVGHTETGVKLMLDFTAVLRDEMYDMPADSSEENPI